MDSTKLKIMRTIKELLELMLDNKQCFGGGLCDWNIKLYTKSLINANEHTLLLEFIKRNRETSYLPLQDFWYKSKGLYYWKPGKITPRIHWIKYQIKQLNKLENGKA